MSGRYCAGFDANGQWGAETGNLAIEKQGAIVDLGQVPEWMKRQLNVRAKDGTLVRYKGHWNTLLPTMGMGPLKTIWATPEIARAAGVA